MPCTASAVRCEHISRSDWGANDAVLRMLNSLTTDIIHPRTPYLSTNISSSFAMPSYNFQDYDVGNNTIVPDQECSLSFTIRTERGFMDQVKSTTVTASSKRGGEFLHGGIDWKKKTMEIQGVTKPLVEVKRKHGGTFSLAHEWTWSTKKYLTTFKKGAWTVRCEEELIATLVCLKRHLFSKDELATLNFATEVSDEEKIFFILALLYHDLQLPPQQRPLTDPVAASDAAKGLAVNAAATAATNTLMSCCSVQ
ncbi:hypothetical protein B0H34DRAFT_86620 [Crassisporium funariophilum]|nr:hypothetical protein B0H34DRAFT_86620 [Crassisporium funariophilum]